MSNLPRDFEETAWYLAQFKMMLDMLKKTIDTAELQINDLKRRLDRLRDIREGKEESCSNDTSRRPDNP